MKRILFLFITFILPLAASLPPNIDHSASQAMYALEQSTKNEHDVATLTALDKLGLSNDAKARYYKMVFTLKQLNSAAQSEAPSIVFAPEVPEHLRKIITSTAKKKGLNLPIAVDINPDLGPLNCGVSSIFAKLPLETDEDRKNLVIKLVEARQRNFPIMTLSLSPQVMDTEFSIPHEIDHIYNFDPFLRRFVKKSTGLSTEELEKKPAWFDLNKLPEKRADKNVIFANPTQETINKACNLLDTADFMAKINKEPVSLYHPTPMERKGYITTLGKQLIAAQNFTNNNNNNNSLVTQNPAKRQRRF